MPRMSEPDDYNPYAPPKEGGEAPARKKKRRRGEGDLAEAIARLNEHLADPDEVRHDAAVAGPRFRTVTYVITGLAAVAVVGTIAAVSASNVGPLMVLAVAAALIFGILAVALWVVDASLVPLDRPAAPEATLRSYFKAMSIGRFGYAWARLCPTAREQTVEAPQLGEVATVLGAFSLADEPGMKAYVNSFARPSGDQMRTMAVKKVAIVNIEDEVATIEVELAFQSWPRWVSFAMVFGFILFRPLIIIGLILYFVMRKRCEQRVVKTLIRGSNGGWYVYAPDVLERG